MEILKFKFIDKNKGCYKPCRATAMSAGLDISSSEDYIIQPNEIKSISTNIAVEISPNMEICIRGRSGLAFKNNVFCIHIGTIDSDYRGEIKLLLQNQSKIPFEIKAGDRVAQLIINKVECVDLVEVNNLSNTKRGEGGFGSTGFQQTVKNTLKAREILEKTAHISIDNKNSFINQIIDDCFEMLKKKNADYADYNIGPFSNFENVKKLSLNVKNSFFVRMTDKVSRIINLLTKSPEIKSESLIDTCMDLINYSVLLLTYERGAETNEEFLNMIEEAFDIIKKIFINDERMFNAIVNNTDNVGDLFSMLKSIKEDTIITFNSISNLIFALLKIIAKEKYNN